MNKKISVLSIIIFIMFFLFSCKENKSANTTIEINKQLDETVDNVKKPKRKTPTTNIKDNQKITSPLYVKVNSEGVWFAYEGELGLVKIVDENNKLLNKQGNSGILSTMDGNSMHSKPAFFETEVDFEIKGEKSGKIIITYNAIGGDEAGTNNTIEIPVTF